MIAVLALLIACTGAPYTDLDVLEVHFPHPEDFKKGTAHGAEAIRVGANACLGCHREDAGAPICASCHPAYPHPDGWLDGETHGKDLGGDHADDRAVCQKCHGGEGLKAPACDTCHTSYPHPPAWRESGHHGVWALARGSLTAACGSCHGAALEGKDPAPACNSCHTMFPHPSNWTDADQHPLAYRADCYGCHGVDGSGGSSGVACSRCHASYPHPAKWAQSGHIATASKVGEDACLFCHDPGDGPPDMPATCGAQCHRGTP